MKNSDKILAHLETAREKLESARILLSENRERGSIDFSYFSMFHAATAIGLSEGKTLPPCSGWLAAFQESLSGEIGSEYYSDLAEAYRLRQVAEYGKTTAIPTGSARTGFERAGQFLSMAESFLKSKG